MDKKHKQHSKNTKKKRSKSKRKDNETEVFVIPPDLLQKLGINLGNVQSIQECPITVSSDTTGFKNQLNTPVKNVTSSNDLNTPVDCEKETSILETANLMTKSVFLSPTFTPVCANIIPGELEIISNAIRTERRSIDALHKSNHELNTNILKQQDTFIPNIEPIKEMDDSDQLSQDTLENRAEELSLAQSECNSENDLVATQPQENHIGFSNDVSRNINMDVIKKTDRKISTDDHLDEAYSSDCSNSNLGPIENSDSSNYIPELFNKSPTQITSKNKINIISEEILSPSQLNELKSLHSPIASDFIPVTIHTVISWNKKNDNFDNDVLATDSLFHKQDNAINALKINNIEGRNHIEDNIKLSIGLPVQIQDQNICHEDKYIDECNLLKEVQQISCTINNNMSQISNEEVLNDNTKIELDNSDSNLGVCIDFEVTDLDKHLEENVDILEEFVNGLTSNDSDEILEKLEQNEKICFNETKLPEMAVEGIQITDNFSSKGDEAVKEETHSKNESSSNSTYVPLDVLSNIYEEMHIDTYDNLPNNVDGSKLEGDVKNNAKESAVNTFEVKQLKEDTGIKNDEKISLLQKSTRHDGEIKEINNEFSLKQHYDLDVSNSKNSSEDSVTKMCDEKTNENDASKNRTSDANVPIEKVEEIAMYLSQCLSSRRLKSKAMFPTRKELIKQTKKNCLKSKLCIQGVEKPGGSKENVKNTKEVILKTYGRVNRLKKKNVPELSETKLNDAALQNESEDLKLQPNSITLSYDCTSKEFCLCHDFGSLTFYDCNSEYEHIHFWEHDNIDCDRDVIFSMYVEDCSMDLYNSNDTDMIAEINEDNPKVIGRSICWNNIRDEFVGETFRGVPNNTDAGTADCLNESIHYSQNLTGTINTENVVIEEHPRENRSGYIPKITVEINYAETEFDGLGFQTAEPDKTMQIDNNDMENVDKTDVDDKIIKKSHYIERRRSSETTLNTIDKEPNKIMETLASFPNPKIEETLDVHSESSEESSSLMGSRSNSNKNEKKNMSKRKRSSKMIEEEPYSKKSIKCGVCEQFLSENEWEDHISHEHCYIAWRQGRTRDSVDLNDAVLLKKLDQIVTNNGELKCSFCEVKKKTVEKFLSHVRKCLKLLDSPNTPDSCTSRNAVSEKLNLTSSNPEDTSKELESISIDAKHGRNKNVKAREKKEIKSISPKDTGKPESTSSERIEAVIMTVDSQGKRKKSTNPESSTSSISELISEEIKSPSVFSKASNKKSKSQSTPKTQISQEQDPKSVSLSPELKREKLRSTTNSSKTNSDKSKSLDAKTSTISKPISEEMTPPPDDSKTTIKKRKSQSIAKNQINPEQDPTPASLNPELKTARHKSTSNASETTSDEPNFLETKAGRKNRKSKSSNSEPFAESPKSTSSISAPIREELKSPPVESKVTTKKSKLQLTPKTQIGQEQDPKSASLSSEHKREKPKSIDAKAGSTNRKSKSSNLEPFAESPKASSSISEPIREELKSPPVESKATIKKRKLQSTPMTQISQEQDPKSASLSLELKKEQLKSTSTSSETISDKLKSSDAKASNENRKSKSINTESISEEPKSSTTSELINKEPIATSIESMYKSKEKESETINLKATGKRKSISTEPIIENLYNNSDAISKESQSRSPFQSMTKCGVCQQDVENDCWIDHIAGHDYLAWEDGSTPLDVDNEEEVRRHLNDLARQIGGLKCSKCGLTRKYLKSYLQHIVKCNGTEDSPQAMSSDSESKLKVKIKKTPAPPKCGVCQKGLTDATWMEHIATEHNYLAWRDGETPLDLDDEEVVRQHLHTIAKQIGELICSKCGLTRRYAKSFLQHINHCEGTVASDDPMASETNDSQLNIESEVNEDVKLPVTCGVCKKEISSVQWILHIQKAHNYMAWKEGESFDINNAEEVQNHLYAISKAEGGLICSKCGLLRKYVKAYQHHFANCAVTPPNYDETIDQTDKVPFCGVCSEKVALKDWINHKMEKHYNIAWTSADIPIDIKNPYAVERLLKEYKDVKKKFVCNVCGSSRVSCMGFYAHILTCGKSEEETKMFQNTCEICNKQYLCIYQNQHMAFHREQEYARERKLKEAEQKAAKVEVTIDFTSGRRRAAEKARTVIENYKTSSQFSHNCPDCGFGSDSRKEVDNHVCKKKSDLDESDASVHSDGSDDDSEESGVDSNVSEEEEPQTIKKRIREYVPLPVKLPRLPFSVRNPRNYLVMCGERLCKANSTTENLFVDWKICQFEPVADDQLVNYLPPLEESCKVKFGEDSWTTYSRFEAKKGKVSGYCIFVGACIQCISWAPGLDDTCNKYLAVTCHPGADLPRYERDVTPLHSGLIQIWNFGNMSRLPEMALGIAHDYGTVWSMDWCPYGARDALPTEDADVTSRLGLLAISCSNGHAYVFSVPYPSTIPLKNDKLIYKLKAVAELRLTMGSDRPIYQATSVRWSQQKDQSFVVVGYGDGTTAYFDLNTESPLLKTKRNDITIFYPYHDERPHNACVLGLSVYSSGDTTVPAGAVCSASPTGAEAVVRAGLRAARLHSRVASSVAMFPPHWPAALLAGDDAIISTLVNELEWWGTGRRLGAVSACAGCAHCGRVAAFQPPQLRLMRLHPAYSETKKQTIGSLQMMPIGKKRKVVTDELTTTLEPITYEEAIRKYGIEFKMDQTIQAPQTNKPRDQFPERFPLGDVRSMAFCPSFKHHGKLAVATHAGIIFLITV